MVTRVLVADTQALFAEAIGGALDQEHDIAVIPQYPTRGRDALETIERHQPDIVLYDNWMLEIDGPTATRALASSTPATKVLLLSWYHGPRHIQAALNAGAAGFLPKSLGLEQLIEAVRRAAGGDPLVFGEELARLIENIDERIDSGYEVRERFASLSPREVQVLRALARPAPTAQVARSLGISAGTLKNHLHHIMAKTSTTTQLEVIGLARELELIDDQHDLPALESGHHVPLTPRRSAVPADGGGRCSVLVADTECLFAQALGRCLSRQSDLRVVPTFPTQGLAALQVVLQHSPDIVLYDLYLRGFQGATAVRVLSRWHPATKPILMSWFHGRPQVRKALATGSLALAPKTAGLANVVEAVRAVHAREVDHHTAELAALVDILREGEAPADDQLERLLTLSLREIQLLQRLALGGPAKRIAEEMSIAVGTVRNTIHQLLAKTGAKSQAEVVAMARHHGFLN